MWTEAQLDIIKNNHKKITLNQILTLVNQNGPPKAYYALRSKCQRMGFFRDRVKEQLPNKNTYNQKYWSEPTITNSYLAGIIAADGCIRKNGIDALTFSYKVAQKDEHLVDMFIKELNFTGKKSYSTAKSPHSDNISNLVCIQVCSFNKPAEDLKKYYNLIPRKTYRLGPTNLKDNKLNLAFIIGLIEGDGSVDFVKKGESGFYPYLGINSSSKAIVEWVKVIIDNIFPKIGSREANVRKHDKDNYYRFYIGGLRACVIIDYINQLNIGTLDRKWKNPEILNYIEEKKKKFPNLFLKV